MIKLKDTDYYETIRNNPALKWLLLQTDLVNGMNPLEEFDWIQGKVRTFEKTAGCITAAIYILFGGLSASAITFSCKHWIPAAGYWLQHHASCSEQSPCGLWKNISCVRGENSSGYG